jgi:hypothetical protein
MKHQTEDFEYYEDLICDDCDHEGAFDLGHTLLCRDCLKLDQERIPPLSDEACRHHERKQMGIC